jgi:hypothetical protein
VAAIGFRGAATGAFSGHARANRGLRSRPVVLRPQDADDGPVAPIHGDFDRDGQVSGEGKPAAGAKDVRRDRLKAALRENLKRRKSQARGRDDLASTEPTDASLDDADENTPGQ